MSFWAVKQLYSLLGEYRFEKVVQRNDDNNNLVYVYEFNHGENVDKKIWAVWSPTGTTSQEKYKYDQKSFTTKLENLPGRPTKVISMALSESDEDTPAWKMEEDGMEFTVTESPVYIIFE